MGTYTSNTLEGTINGTFSVEADAYGSLQLPGGITIENTLRRKTVKSYERVFTNSSQLIDIYTCRWYGQYNRYPLLVLTTIETISGTNTSISHQAAYNNIINSAPTVLDALTIDNSFDLYPNPVSNKLTINLNIHNSGEVVMDLYDIAGNKLHTLINQYTDEGEHIFEIFPQNLGLQNGMYLIKVNATGKILTKEFIYSE